MPLQARIKNSTPEQMLNYCHQEHINCDDRLCPFDDDIKPCIERTLEEWEEYYKRKELKKPNRIRLWILKKDFIEFSCQQLADACVQGVCPAFRNACKFTHECDKVTEYQWRTILNEKPAKSTPAKKTDCLGADLNVIFETHQDSSMRTLAGMCNSLDTSNCPVLHITSGCPFSKSCTDVSSEDWVQLSIKWDNPNKASRDNSSKPELSYLPVSTFNTAADYSSDRYKDAVVPIDVMNSASKLIDAVKRWELKDIQSDELLRQGLYEAKKVFATDIYGVLTEVTKSYSFGQKKYSRNNWRQGFKDSVLVDCCLRHLTKLAVCHSLVAEDSGLHHMAHALANITMLHDQCYRRNNGETVGTPDIREM